MSDIQVRDDTQIKATNNTNEEYANMMPSGTNWVVAFASVALAFAVIPLIPMFLAFLLGAVLNHKRK